MPAWFALSTLKSFFQSLTVKNVLAVILVLFVAFGLYKGYRFAYERGYASRNDEVALLKAQLLKERQKVAALTTASQIAEEKFKSQQTVLQQQLEQQKKQLQEQAHKREVVIREIPKYISVEDDRHCVIPVNFGLLHNQSIEGASTDSQTGLSDTAAGQRGTPSSLTLSEYAAVALYNNSEAVRRGKIIEQWEQWYDQSKAQFDQAQQAAAEAIKLQHQTFEKADFLSK